MHGPEPAAVPPALAPTQDDTEMSPFAFHCTMIVALPLFIGSAAAALPTQTPARASAPFAPIAGMELLPALQRAKDVGPAPADQRLGIAVSLPFARPEAVQAFVDAVSNPHSAHYPQFLTPHEVRA